MNKTIYKSVGHFVGNSVGTCVCYPIRYFVSNSIKNPVWNFVYNPIKNPIWHHCANIINELNKSLDS